MRRVENAILDRSQPLDLSKSARREEPTIDQQHIQDLIPRHFLRADQRFAFFPSRLGHDDGPHVEHGDSGLRADLPTGVCVRLRVRGRPERIRASLDQVGFFELVLVDGGRGQEDQSGVLGGDGRVREDGVEVLLVFGEGDVLARRAPGQASVVGAEEDGLVPGL